MTRDAPATSASGGSSPLSLTPPNPTSEPTLSPPAPGTLASEDQSYRTKAGERTTNPHGHEGFTTAPSPGMVSSQPWSQETNQELPPPFPASTGGTTGMVGPSDSPVPTADRATTEVHGPRLQEETTPAQQRSNHHVRFTTPTPETPSLDESLEYCIGNVLLFWKPPSVFSNWSPSNFTVEGVRYSSMEQFIMAEKCKLFGDLATRERILGVSDPRLHKRWGRAAKHFNEGVWKANRKYITLVGLYEKFLQDPAMRQHLLSSGDRLLAEASPRDTIWGIGLRADDPDAATPSTWLGENLLGSALQQVRTLLREATPPKTPGTSKQGRAANPNAGLIFEIHPDTNKALDPPPTSTSVWPADTPKDHGPSVMAISAQQTIAAAFQNKGHH